MPEKKLTLLFNTALFHTRFPLISHQIKHINSNVLVTEFLTLINYSV